MAVNWKQIMIMRLKGVSQDRVAGAARCSKRDVARASRVIREHGVTMETLMGMGDAQVRERWFPAKPREADGSYAQPDMDSYVERKGVLLQCLFDRFGSVFPQCGLMVFPGVVIVSR